MQVREDNRIDDYSQPPQEQGEDKKPALAKYVSVLEFLPVPQMQRSELLDIDVVSELNRKAIASNDNTIVASTPGSRKTTATVNQIKSECKDKKRVQYTAPTNELVDETFNKIKSIGYCIRYYARNNDNCKAFARERYNRAIALNKQIFNNVCIFECTEMEIKECKYLHQLDKYRHGAICCTHAAAPFVNEKIEQKGIEFDSVFLDENPMKDIIKSKQITIDNVVLLRNGMEDTVFWRKLKAETSKVIPQIGRIRGGKTRFLRLALEIDAEYIEEMRQGAAWEGLCRYQAMKDREAHRNACSRAAADVKAYNEELPRSNKRRLRQYKEEKKQYITTIKKQKGLVIDDYPEFVPLAPREVVLPLLIISPLPNKAEWEKEWADRTWKPIEGTSETRDAGIDAADIVEAILRREEIEKLYDVDKPDPGLEHVDPDEFKLFRAALQGESGSQVYFEAKEIIDRNEVPQLTVLLKLVTRKNLNMKNAKIKASDGTADKDEWEALLGKEMELSQNDAKLMPTRTIHLQQSLGSIDARMMSKRAKKNDSELRRYLKRTMSHLLGEDNKVLLLTHLVLRDQILELAKKIDHSREYVVTNYYGNRGVNKYEDCNAVIAFGTPYVNPIEFEPLSIAIFGYINNKWIAEQGMKELIQSIHRIRPINHRSTIIVLGKYFPSGAFGRPDVHIDYQRKGGQEKKNTEAAEILIPIAEEYGCISQAIAAREGILDQTDMKGIEHYEKMTGEKPVFIYPHKEWSSILRLIIEATDLPEMKHQAGPGRAKACAGTFEALRKYHNTRRIAFFFAEWKEGTALGPKPAKRAKLKMV